MEDGFSSVLGRMCSVAATDVLLTANKFQQPVKRFLLSPVFGKNSPFTRRAGKQSAEPIFLLQHPPTRIYSHNRYRYITVDLAMAASQNGCCSLKKPFHQNKFFNMSENKKKKL
jgi:hypothetical protein